MLTCSTRRKSNYLISIYNMNWLFNNYRIMYNLHRAIYDVTSGINNITISVEIHWQFLGIHVIVFLQWMLVYIAPVITCNRSANCFSCLFYVTLKLSFQFMCETFDFIYRKSGFCFLQCMIVNQQERKRTLME